VIEVNKVYQTDNLELLKNLNDNTVDLIYCDILYNTRKKFRDYNDNLGDTKKAIEWYKPRLIEMFRVLKETGTIYLQMDWRLVHYIKIEMDKIFGEDNFRNEIIWSYSRWTNSGKDFVRSHDNILRYSKSNNYIYNIQYEDFSEKSKHKGSRFSKKEDDGKLKQQYISEERKKAMRDVWEISILNSQSKERVDYNTQKPKELIERIILASTNEGDLVADFFCGSGTSLVVAKELGRNYIGCDLNKKAVDITNQRLNELNW